MTYTASDTYTYTDTDIEKVMRRFTADIVMIAQSTGAITEAKAREYAHDMETLAKNGYLKKVDLTLLSGINEVRATQYTVNTVGSDLTSSRPGGVMWPRVPSPDLRVIVFHTDAYDAVAREVMKPKLKIGWTPTRADTSHSGLTNGVGRDYASNGWGLQRKDFGQ
ncbi:hypothetical protein [Aromatoleum bremense]|uniref:Bacterial HORMA domain-containing protein n=1 Tax=Aromatoleum bremense TaxID=76115 RepID=A0ABX1NW77_9RHOO|nr:hypothetical protein [Aromatoleum bremense]NMG15752.1 hypothetical protein [Aromatoleum bremense]QTQ30050.1 Uncharacterized protein pbN1_00570 [Aromatoleum bremense]